MFMQFDFSSDVPIYSQLMHQIIEGVARKDLLPGDSLPSIRSLASDLGINHHTVNKAYRLLQNEGYIQIHRQKGVQINPQGVPMADDAYLHKLSHTLQPLIADSLCRGMTKEEFMTLYQEIASHILGDDQHGK